MSSACNEAFSSEVATGSREDNASMQNKKRFRAKWLPVRVKTTRQGSNLESESGFMKRRKSSEPPALAAGENPCYPFREELGWMRRATFPVVNASQQDGPMTDKYIPMKRFTDVFPATSGNTVNGQGENSVRRPSPFFWHPPDRQTHGALQAEVTNYHRQSSAVRKYYAPDAPGGRGPKLVEKAGLQTEKTASDWTSAIKAFALGNESDLVGITPVDPLHIYEGYEIHEPTVIMIGVAMDHSELNQAPPSFENPSAAVVVASEYNRAARACRKLANFIRSQGYEAKAFQGPYATAMNMIPLALAAGFGELGKHGSIINETYGSSFRLSAVTTNMPLVSDSPADIGAEDFCLNCQICTRACPPDAIHEDKQMVRGVEKWYVDFDKCIPYFGETLGCGICIARCPWSFPGTGPKLSQKLLARRARKG